MRNKCGYIMLLLGLSFYLTGCEQDQRTPPNVILIMTDDQGYRDVAANSNPIVETPNMDRSHDKAIRLENFHVVDLISPMDGDMLRENEQRHMEMLQVEPERMKKYFSHPDVAYAA